MSSHAFLTFSCGFSPHRFLFVLILLWLKDSVGNFEIIHIIPAVPSNIQMWDYKLQVFPTSESGIHPRYSPGIGS